MSNGVKGGANRGSIPTGVEKMVENIKEITGPNHSEDEIYVVLRECSMDPNETIQKLLLLDTFHEVKRKRDRKKENPIKEPVQSKWKPGTQTRANRVGRGNYLSRCISQDAGGGRIFADVKESASSHLTEKGTSKAPLSTSQETSSFGSPTTVVSNGPYGINSQSANIIYENHTSAGDGVNQSNTTTIGSIKSSDTPGTNEVKEQQMLELSNSATYIPSSPVSESYLSSSDTVPFRSQDSQLPSAVDTIRRELANERSPAESLDDNLTDGKSASAEISAAEVGITNFEQKMPNDLQGVGKNQHLESMQPASSNVSRPSSNHNNRSQEICLQKVGPGKEWKPKTMNSNNVQCGTTASSTYVPKASVGSHSEPQTTPVVFASMEATSELQRKFEETHMPDSQHVIIPDHLHVPGVEKLGFCFGSFDSSFGLDMNQNGVRGSEKIPILSESYESIEGHLKELQLSNQIALISAEDTVTKYPDYSEPVEVSSTISHDYIESKPEVTPGSYQHHVVHTPPNYSFDFMSPTLGSQIAPSENSVPQTHDASRLPRFVVPQSFAPASYYAQFYPSGLDGDGCISPFQTAGPANMFNGSAAAVSAQTSQTPLESQGVVPLVSSTASQTPVMTQQPLAMFRHPTGVHLSHYPPNYIPYGPYYPPFYVPPPAIHHVLSNGAFAQQPQTSAGLYPTAPGTNAKLSVSEYKQGLNTGGSTHIGVPGNYGPYGLPMPNYTSGSETLATTLTSNAKENNVYDSGQQNRVWYTTSGGGRDISTIHASSLPQSQLQTGQGPFTHPLLQVINNNNNHVDTVRPTGGGVYQQHPYTA